MLTPRLRRWLAVADELAWQQYRDPVGFWESIKRDGTWRALWPARLAILGSLPVFMLVAVLFRETNLAQVIAYGIMAGTVLNLEIASAVTVVGGPFRFWFLYVYSPPVLILLFLCGLAYLTPIGVLLGWMTSLPFFWGMFFTDTCSIWVHKEVDSRQFERARQRGGGPAADLPALTLQRRVYWLRFLIASLLIAAALVHGLWGEISKGLWLSVALVSGAIGCLRLEAALLAWISHTPLTAYNPQQRRWRTTYIGRTALIVPRRVMLQSLTAKGSAAEASATFLALLSEGQLGLAARAACRQLPEIHLHALLLQLSLQTGGAEALRFLQPGLPPPLHAVAGRYADLAAEAAKPLDLQHWIALLPSGPEAMISIASADRLHQIMSQAREALLAYEYQPDLRNVQTDLENAIQAFNNPTPAMPQPAALPLNWPWALSQHLEYQLQRLQNATGSPHAQPVAERA